MNSSKLMCSLLAAITFVFVSVAPIFADAQPPKPTFLQQQLAALEASSDGRIGLSAIDTANKTQLQYRANERFPFCSTFKVMLVSAILKQSMTDPQLLQEKVTYKKDDLLPWSPVTQQHIADGMTVSELCAAAITHSDNTAANLLIKKLGGPQAVTAFARSIGDQTFRLDRFETELNSAIPGDVRDTTTPAAMQKGLQQLALAQVLAPAQREQLQTWLKGSVVGQARIRAGVPRGWVVGDKTGTGDYGTTNNIAVIWPPKCPPIVVVIYFTQHKKDAAPRDDVIASATRMMISELEKTDSCF